VHDLLQAQPAIEVRGGGPMSRRRLEVMMNCILGSSGPGIAARQCGPGFLAAGNRVLSCGLSGAPALDFQACTGVLVEDNEILEIEGPGIRASDCARARINGNEIVGTLESKTPRRGATGLLLEGAGTRHVRVTDNRVRSVRGEGIRVANGRSLRLTGNEVEDCGFGIEVRETHNVVVVGNDCRDNSRGGIRVDESVQRGIVALNYAILNGPVDLEVRGSRVRSRNNKIDREESVSRGGPKDGAGIPA
jgi:parallel beta-helix repeat protein